MLRKLYKHEFISLYRVLLPIYGVLFGLSALTRIITVLSDNENEILEFWKVIILSLSFITLVGLFVISFVVIVVRFYQNMLSKQGYLTNTLPFKAHNHILCKLICGIVVEISNVIIATGALAVIFGTKENIKSIFETIKMSFISFKNLSGTANAVAVVIEIVFIALFSITAGILMFYASMTIGQLFKNKILGSVVAYFCIYAAMQVISTIFITIVTVVGIGIPETLLENASITTVSQGFIIFIMFVEIAQGLIYYFITNHFLSKKLNLE